MLLATARPSSASWVLHDVRPDNQAWHGVDEHATVWAQAQHPQGPGMLSRQQSSLNPVYSRPLDARAHAVLLQFQCIGRGASKVVYKGFDEVEGIEVAWNEVACSDWVLGR